MLEDLNLNDLEILKNFSKDVDLRHYSELDGKTVLDIIESSGFSHTKIRNSIRLLVKKGLLKEGLKKR